jgi:DinB family protein
LFKHGLGISLCLLIIAGAAGLFAQTAAEPKTVSEALDHYVSGPERACLVLARAMPEDRYNFVPTNGEFKGVRSFALLVKHIAVDNYLNGAALLGEKPPIDSGPHENGPDSVRTKEQTVKMLADSFVYLHKAMRKVNDKNLMETVDYPGGGRVTRLAVVISALAHPMDIYGQMIEYLRMNGIDPQKLPG